MGSIQSSNIQPTHQDLPPQPQLLRVDQHGQPLEFQANVNCTRNHWYPIVGCWSCDSILDIEKRSQSKLRRRIEDLRNLNERQGWLPQQICLVGEDYEKIFQQMEGRITQALGVFQPLPLKGRLEYVWTRFQERKMPLDAFCRGMEEQSCLDQKFRKQFKDFLEVSGKKQFLKAFKIIQPLVESDEKEFENRFQIIKEIPYAGKIYDTIEAEGKGTIDQIRKWERKLANNYRGENMVLDGSQQQTKVVYNLFVEIFDPRLGQKKASNFRGTNSNANNKQGR